MSCSRTQHSDAGDARTRGPLLKERIHSLIEDYNLRTKTIDLPVQEDLVSVMAGPPGVTFDLLP